MIVVDTNIIAYLHLPSEYTALALNVYNKDHEWNVPTIWRSEFRNILIIYMRKKILNVEEAIFIMDKSEKAVYKEYSVNSNEVIKLGAQSNCSAYDIEFISLAKFLNVPLIAFDKEILRKFPSVAISAKKFLDE